MDTITLGDGLLCNALAVPMAVADRLINEANESQMKIYMYLLKAGSSSKVTIESIADYFNYSEADVKRALRFWNIIGKENTANDSDKISDAATGKGDNVVSFSVRPSYSKEKIAEFSKIPEISQLMFVAEQYMARPLKPDDVMSMLYLYDELGFSADLIECLLEYCIENNKKSFRAIENVALEWKGLGVASVEDAKRLTRQVPKEMPEILSAFGLDSNKQVIDAEIIYVRKWVERFGFTLDIIKEACARTVMSLGKADFRYANGILTVWHDAKVSTIADVLALDEQFRQKKVTDAMMGREAVARTNNRRSNEGRTAGANSKFHNFSEREYDYASLLKDVLSN